MKNKILIVDHKERSKAELVAVLTKEYAESIGADKYSKDAMETVRYAETIFKDNE